LIGLGGITSLLLENGGNTNAGLSMINYDIKMATTLHRKQGSIYVDLKY
jgi:hypothetical protein